MVEHETRSFAVCINSSGYPASLEVGKIYRVVADESAAAAGLMRIVDESGEDYAFAADRFYPIELPAELERALTTAA